ncbi:MAG: hypothetical protein ACREMC_07240 [Gemmatimonadales bacterium]
MGRALRWGRSGALAGALVFVALARGAAAQRADTAPPRGVLVRPLASLLLPGAGQLLAGQDRGAAYLAAELYLVSRFLQLDRDANREAQRFRALAYDVARRPFSPTRRDTVFEYYEQMEHFAESGRYDTDPGPAFVPERDASTYNGAVWLLARQTFWEDPNTPPDPMSLEYWRALQFYQARAVGPDFLWSWRDHSLEHQVFRETIHRSDLAFRRAQNQVGLLLANHVLSTVDALISSQLTEATGRPAALRTTVAPAGVARVQLSIAF